MTGYTRVWDCRVCGDPQESINWPSGAYVCETCLRPLMDTLCREIFPGKTRLDPGIDPGYFEKRAYDYATLVLGKGQHGKRRAAA